MIAIFDNGQDYSGHAIYFVQLPPGWTAKAVLSLCRLEHYGGDGWRLLGTARAIRWRDGGCCDLKVFLDIPYKPAVREHPRWADLCALLGVEHVHVDDDQDAPVEDED